MKTKIAAQVSYKNIRIGSVYSFSKVLRVKDVKDYAELIDDFNPLHTNPSFGRKSKFGKNIIHGMLAGSLFSTLVGMHCPGEKSLYLSQTLQFRKPIFPGERLVVRGTVTGKTDSAKIIILKTEIIVKNQVAVSGEAKAMVLEGG